jgi:ABC-type antimicrobial peptide transport system permease subunit
VAERRRELGIRMALGATVAQAMRTVALPGVLLVAAGVALGSALAYLTVQALKSMIWGVRPTDPATFLSVAAIFLIVAAAASFLPALRVARLDPARTLRSE